MSLVCNITQYSDRPFLKKFRGRPNETSCYVHIFLTVLIRLTSLSLPKTMNHRQCRLIFVTGGQYHARNKSDRPFLKKSRGRPYETSCFIFLTVLSRLTSQILPKTLNNIQCRMLFVTGVQYCLLYTSPSPRDQRGSRMPSSA